MIPLIHMYRARATDNDDPAGSVYLDCDYCRLHNAAETRRQYHCGLLSEAEWRGQRAEYPRLHESPTLSQRQWLEDREYEERGEKPPRRTCPGYLATLPEVREAVSARAWYEKGLLEQRYDAYGYPLTVALMDALQVLEGAIADAQSFDMRERQRD